MKQLSYVVLALVVGCSTPPSKEPNSSTNSSPNNLNSQNVVPNNGTTPTNSQTGNNETVIDPGDFDQACDFDTECELVWGGDVCGCGAICGDAIAASAVPDFRAAKDAVVCPDNAEPIACPGAACQEQMAVCSSGDCEAITAITIQADQFDQSCEIDEECVLITTGQICSSCDCGRGAINHNALDDYNAARGEPDCNPGPSACDCAPLEGVWCDTGTCSTR